MITRKRHLRKTLPQVIIASFILLNESYAGLLKITNENADNIEVRIIPEPESEMLAHCWKCIAGTYESTAPHEANLIISPEEMRGSQSYAVVGTTGGFLFNGTCRNLSLSKNYDIHFLSDDVGTSCICREI